MSIVPDSFVPGLEGVVAARTAISGVDGAKGELIIRGFRIEDFAPLATFEEAAYLLWNDVLPTQQQLDAFGAELAARRSLDRHILDLLAAAAKQRVDRMNALRMACAALPGRGAQHAASREAAMRDDALTLIATFPVIIAAYHRLLQGDAPVAPREDLSHAANFLYMLDSREAPAAFTRALDTYWTTVSDHGLNASTFTARVITSTGSDIISAVTGALGALKGPLHGGAPGPALDLVFEIGEPGRADSVLRDKLARGERLMGFGHRVYRTRDPRAEVLAAEAERLFERAGNRQLYELARTVEARAVQLLREHKPGRTLQTNVEFYTALVLHGIEFPTALFTPAFAAGRVAGWTAHCREQLTVNKLFRPDSVYVGARDRRWIPAEARTGGASS